MCEWGTQKLVLVTVPANLSHTGEIRSKQVGVDACIAPIVEALNRCGIGTLASCCGHGKRPGNIVLQDGRELVIAPDFETGRRVDDFLNQIGFSPINPE